MKELISIQSTLNAPKGQYNSFGKYKYRSCEDILGAVKPLLNQHGCTLTISDDVVMVGDSITHRWEREGGRPKDLHQGHGHDYQQCGREGSDHRLCP